MASALWGNVYYGQQFAGTLSELPGGRVAFQYHEDYNGPAIAFGLPVASEPYVQESGLHPFFDNLIAEGWLRDAQARAMGLSRSNRLGLLLTFGRDCAGAVSVIDPERTEVVVDPDLTDVVAALQSRASLSGVQPKLFAVKDNKRFRPARAGELSTYIAKLPSRIHGDLIELEWLTTRAMRILLPKDPIVELEIGDLPGIAEEVLYIKRFDRTNDGQRLHFEEFNSLLGKISEDKYQGSYEQMGKFISTEPSCIRAEGERLLRRILACLLLGNTDAHLKNFAMMHQDGGLRLAPSYDLVASAVYKEYNTIALGMGGAANLRLADLAPKHLIALTEGFGLPIDVLTLAIQDLKSRRAAMEETIENDQVASKFLKRDLLDLVQKRWNKTFELVGTMLSKKQRGVEKLRGFHKRD